MKNFFVLSSFVLLITALVLPEPGYCWGDEGHAIVALLAQKILTNDKSPEAQTALSAVTAILGETTIDKAATWPDLVKEQSRGCNSAPYVKDPNYKNKNSSALCDAYKYTSNWHFTDSDGVSYHSDPNGENYFKGDLVVILRQLSHALMGKEDSTLTPFDSYATWKSQCEKKADHNCKKEALEFLIHFVGDIHQPLHSGASCDVGGNAQYIVFFGQSVVKPTPHWCAGKPETCANYELHAVWDTNLLLHTGEGTPIPYVSNEDYATQLFNLMAKSNSTSSTDAAHCMTTAASTPFDIEDSSFPLSWVNESLCYMPQIYNFLDDSVAKKDTASKSKKVVTVQKKTKRATAQAEEVAVPNLCAKERAKVTPVGKREETNYSAFAIGQKYYETNITTINERLYWGGYRLANLLKVMYGTGDLAKTF